MPMGVAGPGAMTAAEWKANYHQFHPLPGVICMCFFRVVVRYPASELESEPGVC